jgi:putative DNA primase/helicase
LTLYKDHISQFLKTLYGNFESGYIYLWTLPDHLTWCFSMDELETMITAAGVIQDERDVYFGIGSVSHSLPKNERAKVKDVTCLPGFWMDFDIAAPGAHAQTQLPTTAEEALSVLPDFLQPSIVVWSGYGLHLYWLFKEPWELDTPEENQRASDLSLRLQGYIKKLASERGWQIESTFDLARVLRVPGTLNHKKNPSQPVYMTKFESDRRYDPSELEDIIPEIDFKTTLTNHGDFERRPTDASANLMIANCQFLQHCSLNAKKINYGEWLSMLTNVVRGTDGIDKCHELSRQDPDRYSPKATDFKVSEALKMNPHTCEYIRATHGFKCPDGCGVKSPCSFSLGKVDQARAKVNMIGIPSTEKIFNDEMLTALSIVKHKDAALYAKTKDRLKGTINLRDLESAIKQHNQKESNSEIVVDTLEEIITDAPIDEIKYPAGFTVTNSGVNYIKMTDNGPQYYRACGCPVVISARLFNQDTETESLKISYKHMGRWRELVVPRSVAVDSRKVISLADKGIAVSSEGAKHLAKYFDEFLFNNPGIPVQKAVSRFGWRGQEFIFPGLSPSVEIDVDDIGSKHALKGFTATGNVNDWLNVANTVRNYSPNARFILSAGFAPPLLKVLSQRNFIIHNHGNSQDGKTATLWLAMSIWGDPNTIISSFDNTSTSLERRASLFSDLPLGINEREVLNQLKKQDISGMLYMLGEGKGKGRGGKTGLQELNTWRTVVLTTGEGPLTNASSMDGLMTRTIELEGGPLAGNKDLARYLYGFLPTCHGHAGLAFMRGLLGAQKGELVDYYRQAQGWLRQYYNDRIDSHLDALAAVMTADYYSSVWVFGKEPSIANAEAYAMATAIGGKLIRRVEASESERAWLEFQDWVGENHEKLSTSYSNIKIGTKDSGYIYIIRRVVNEFLERYSSAQKIIQAWADTGKIKTSIDSTGKMRFDTQKKLGGAVVRCIVFPEQDDGLFG